ncbi:glycosyltransferase [Stenotrophomonas mori]|uniref:Glycosyltransferase n=1 Tax=Stenotrophomonas mori TaxID=2871096 RepID=A0ABT0SDL3_9GAMM|nr:glycosyltransferase [Stenotrophomonas mori]MCL7713408.1 glycosyltransferase [Stenotrophomonas mori]
MKFVVVTYGTEGDTRPLAALCHALIAAGHEALLLADGGTLASARALGIPHAALSGDIRAALMPGQALSAAVREKGGFNHTARALAKIANAQASAWMEQVLEATAACDALIVSGLAAFVGLSVAERRGIRAIGTGLIPITPTSAFPSPFLPPRAVPRVLNRTSQRIVNALLWTAFRRAVNQARVRVCGLPPRWRVWTEHPMLYGVSPSLLPTPADWPANARICGQWNVPESGWSPPPDLVDFLAAGEAPLYIGFGSMAGFSRNAFLERMVEAVGSRRALFFPGWSGMEGAGLPGNFHTIAEVPHGWLFPRVSTVVHHGGSGTTHSAARAGVPSVVLPFAGDQFFWADRLQRLGVAAAAGPGRDVSGARLAAALARAGQPDMRARARALGGRLAQEDGTAVAVAAIAALMGGRG